MVSASDAKCCKKSFHAFFVGFGNNYTFKLKLIRGAHNQFKAKVSEDTWVLTLFLPAMGGISPYMSVT